MSTVTWRELLIRLVSKKSGRLDGYFVEMLGASSWAKTGALDVQVIDRFRCWSGVQTIKPSWFFTCIQQ